MEIIKATLKLKNKNALLQNIVKANELLENLRTCIINMYSLGAGLEVELDGENEETASGD